MHKVFCDRDGSECEARTGYLHMTVVHRTSQAEVVGEDEHRPVELCGSCIDQLAAFLGPAFKVAGPPGGVQETLVRDIRSP